MTCIQVFFVHFCCEMRYPHPDLNYQDGHLTQLVRSRWWHQEHCWLLEGMAQLEGGLLNQHFGGILVEWLSSENFLDSCRCTERRKADDQRGIAHPLAEGRQDRIAHSYSLSFDKARSYARRV